MQPFYRRTRRYPPVKIPEVNSKEFTNRCVGTIVGFAIGDALGMPAEFLTRDQIRRYYGKTITDFLRAHQGHASDFLPSGSYTDDTQMMPRDKGMLCCHGISTQYPTVRPCELICGRASISQPAVRGRRAEYSAAAAAQLFACRLLACFSAKVRKS